MAMRARPVVMKVGDSRFMKKDLTKVDGKTERTMGGEVKIVEENGLFV